MFHLCFHISEAPQGSLPYLTVDGKITVSQSTAIFRYLAREFCKFVSSNVARVTRIKLITPNISF